MTPTSIPTTVPAPAQPPTAPQTTPSPDAPFDFLLMLGQLVADAPVVAAPTSGTAPLAQDASDASLASDAEVIALDALLALPAATPIEPLRSASLSAPQADLIASELQFSKSAAIGPRIAIDPKVLEAVVSDPAITTSDLGHGAEPQQASLQPAPETANTPRASAAEQAISRPVHVPVGSKMWTDEIGARVTMMAEHGKQTASLRLSPEHLGPLEIRVTINQDQAQVWFGAAHADTRAAIEHALPRLRELFAAQGMSLTDAGVSHETPREQTPGHQPSSALSSHIGSEESAPLTAVAIKLGLVDAYA